VAREEIFGPVTPILTFDTVDEVVARVNATTYGLGAYLYTRDLGRALSLAERLEYGLIRVNDASGYTHETPFGGFSGRARPRGWPRTDRSVTWRPSQSSSTCPHDPPRVKERWL